MAAVQAVNTNNFPTELSNELKGPWAILGILSLIKKTLSKCQHKIADSTQKLIENGNKVQDKRSKELKELTKFGLEALKIEAETKLFREIGVYFTVAAILAGPMIAALKVGQFAFFTSATKAFAAPLLSLVGGGLQISAEVMSIETANRQQEIAKIERHNNVDAGLTSSNRGVVSFAGETYKDAADAIVKLQRAITEIINSIGSALQISIR